jgi:hypothetical protein
MNGSEGQGFSDRPQIDEKKVEAIIDQFCSPDAMAADEQPPVKKSGIDVSSRADAIRKTLKESGGPLHVFGNIERDIFKEKG